MSRDKKYLPQPLKVDRRYSMKYCTVKDCKNKYYSSGYCGTHYNKNHIRPDGYRVWTNMKTRCYNVNCKYYNDYGGRGIKVCDRWLHSFSNFINDMGERPSNLTLERVNNDGNYEPSNCRWATYRDQSLNHRKNKNNTSGEKGISWYKATSQWEVRCCNKYYGRYKDKSKAISIRDYAYSLIEYDYNAIL